MRSKLFIFIVLALLILPLTLAETQSLGVFKLDKCVTLLQNCADCSFVNITKVTYPNSSIALSNVEMTKDGTAFSYVFCDTSKTGTYFVSGFANPGGVITVWTYDFKITSTGEEFTTSNAIIYITLLILLVSLFIYSLSRTSKVSDYSWVLGLISVAYILLILILFISWQIAENFLTSIPVIGTLLYFLFYFTLILFFPFFLICAIYLFSKLKSEKDINSMVEMGYDADEARKIKRR